MNPTHFQDRFRWGALVVGLFLVFGPFQNCTVYESPDRKIMNEEGFPVESNCAPYITQEKAAEILGNLKTQVMFLASDKPPQTCAVTIPSTNPTGLTNFTCTFSESNALNAKTPKTPEEGLIGTAVQGPSEFYYSYSVENAGDGLITNIITVGALDGRNIGVRCGCTFKSSPSADDLSSAVVIGQGLVREMILGAQ